MSGVYTNGGCVGDMLHWVSILMVGVRHVLLIVIDTFAVRTEYLQRCGCHTYT